MAWMVPFIMVQGDSYVERSHRAIHQLHGLFKAREYLMPGESPIESHDQCLSCFPGDPHDVFSLFDQDSWRLFDKDRQSRLHR